MLQNGIITPSNSPWSSPLVVVPKKNGDIRLGVDYRKLNNVTKQDAYALPRIDATFHTLAGSTVFSTLDLYSGYWQIHLDEHDMEKTALPSPIGFYEFSVMPFGLKNAPATCQRLMNNAFGNLDRYHALVYLDDIVIFSNDYASHLKHFKSVYCLLKSMNLKLRMEKCTFFRSEIKFLGFVINEQGISTDPDNVSAVKEWKIHKSRKENESFLGFVSYYRSFIPNLAEKESML
ncbi:Retrovirus-related Pol polyprotein [Thelohanellus kitauei]|uniref:Retrovirus-related Pol polyprotein n=1 Tax=Thelohanellus kitauei TaxID=669202 RepID=A0A0C2MN21_THEKT|nr:Retrovirus-related Pol polyprotein [Thelohanellus kitauei]